MVKKPNLCIRKFRILETNATRQQQQDFNRVQKSFFFNIHRVHKSYLPTFLLYHYKNFVHLPT